MAIVISKNSALNNDFWKDTDRAISAVMQDADKEKTKYDELVSDLAIEKKSKKYAEKQTGVTSLASFDVVSEGDVAPLDDIQETNPKLIIHSAFSKSVVITKEMKDDSSLDEARTIARNLVLGYKRTRAELTSNALSVEGAEFTIGPRAKKLDRTTNDGLALFATNHPAVKANVATQSNVFTNAFGNNANMLTRLANIGRNFKNDSGQIMGYTFDTIVVPGNCWELEETVKRIINSNQVIASPNNDINTQKGIWKLVVDPLWQAASGTAPYIIFSSEARNAMNGMVFYDRTPLDVMDDVNIHTRNLEYNGYARMSCGFNDWRWVIMGGAQSGTELS